MSLLRRIVLVRHGETDGQSSTRLHGSSDVPLSAEGREQMQAVARSLAGQRFDVVVASPLRRSWQSAWIVSRGAPVSLEPDFREIHFGHWEGRSLSELEQSDPVAFADWKARAPGFEYPGGEARAEFRARVERGLARLQASGARSALGVLHKGVIRVIAAALSVDLAGQSDLALGTTLVLTRQGAGFALGQRGSDPEALAELAS
jgi:broad specificity phosphatase PhoE